MCHEAAAQRNELEREQYRTALDCLILHPHQVVFVDETHKDHQASRRRKAWGRRNSGGVALKRWFATKARYTMIASLDINGFIDATVDCVLRSDNVNEPDTVDEDYFVSWVENFLCPVLGKYSEGEPRLIVVMDNAATHMSQRVGELIRATGAYLVYTASYSPDLNAIEYAFNIYKASLKRNSVQFDADWYSAHIDALEEVNEDICIREFQKCGVPLSNSVLTTEEKKKLILVLSCKLINL